MDVLNQQALQDLIGSFLLRILGEPMVLLVGLRHKILKLNIFHSEFVGSFLAKNGHKDLHDVLVGVLQPHDLVFVAVLV